MPVQRLTPERRKELTRQTLIEAAVEVFTERGVQAASLDEIAERAGFTRGAIYSNFGGKDELILAVLDWYGRKVTESYGEEADIEGWDPVAGAKAWSKVIRGEENLVLLRTEFELHALRDPEFRVQLAEQHRRELEWAARFIEARLKAAGFRLKIPSEDFAEIGWAASDGLVMFSALIPERAEHYDRLAQELFVTAFGAWIEPIEDG